MILTGPRLSVFIVCLTVSEVVWPLFHYFGMYLCAGFLDGSVFVSCCLFVGTCLSLAVPLFFLVVCGWVALKAVLVIVLGP